MGIQTIEEAIEYHEKRAKAQAAQHEKVSKDGADYIRNRLAGKKKLHPATMRAIEQRIREGY